MTIILRIRNFGIYEMVIYNRKPSCVAFIDSGTLRRICNSTIKKYWDDEKGYTIYVCYMS